MKTLFSALFLIVLEIGLGRVSAHPDVPLGFRFDRSGVKITGHIAKMVNVQTRSFHRDRYIDDYKASLNSADLAEQMWGAWALGNFQSEAVLDALLTRGQTETAESVVQEIYTGLSLTFELTGFGHTNDKTLDSKKRQIVEWKLAYQKLGYQGLMARGWEVARKRGPDGINQFIAGISGRFDPKLISILLDVRSSDINAEANEEVERTILSWSGFDLKYQSISEIKNVMQSDNSLSAENISARYLEYFKKLGYVGTAKNIAGAILLSTQDKYSPHYREMALRMLSCD